MIKNFYSVFIVLFIFLIISSIYIFFPKLPNSIDNRLRDYMFELRGEVKPKTDTVLIIDIDEKSLKQLGQWPWSRHIIAQILRNLDGAEVGIIGFDIVFAEDDRTSPHKVFEKYNLKLQNEKAINYDLDLAHAVSSTPTILGYQFEFGKNKFISKEAPSIQTIFRRKFQKEGEDYLIKAQGTVLNIPIIQDNSYSSGFFNNIPDEAGIIRSVPLIISYDDEIYPSLALETLRVAMGIKQVTINYNKTGIESLQLANLVVPTDRFGRLLINFRGKEKAFKYISAVDIYNNNFKNSDIKDKIVLIGTSAGALMDLRATPFESVFPGVEIHANAIDNILSQDFLHMPSWVDGANIVLILFLCLFTFYMIKKLPIWLTPIFILSLIFIVSYFIYYMLFDIGIVLSLLYPLLTIVLSGIISLIVEYFFETKKKEAIKNKFASKVSKDVMEELLKDTNSQELKAQNKEITIMFSDIRGFTNISEQIAKPEVLVEYLNQYMEPMSKILTKYEGTIDKYIGDSIMAYWNAPFNTKNHADKAVKSALEQQNELKKVNKLFNQKNKPIIKIGIGITTGTATVGEIGGVGRSDYTVIGDTVNLASRLESLCKFYGAQIIISEQTKEKLKENYIFRYLDFAAVKGKAKPIKIWEVVGKIEENNEILKKELNLYQKALNLYYNKNINDAIQLFDELLKNHKELKIYNIYKKRCEEYIKNKQFNEVYIHSEK